MPTGTERTEKSNLAADYKKVAEYAQAMFNALVEGDKLIEANVDKGTMESALSGEGAGAILAQWEEVKSRFMPFYGEFIAWDRAGKNIAKKNAEFAETVSHVGDSGSQAV